MTWVCSRCGESDSPRYQNRKYCKRCHAKQMREKRNQLTPRDKEMASYLTKINRAESHEQIEAALVAILTHFGGLEGFTLAYVEFFERALLKGTYANQCFSSILQMCHYVTHRRNMGMPDTEGMSKHELGATLMMMGLRMCEEAAPNAAE